MTDYEYLAGNFLIHKSCSCSESGAGGEVPGLELVEVDLGDGVDLERAAVHLALEVVGDELLVRGMEAEAGASEVASAAAVGAGGAEEEEDEGWIMCRPPELAAARLRFGDWIREGEGMDWSLVMGPNGGDRHTCHTTRPNLIFGWIEKAKVGLN